MPFDASDYLALILLAIALFFFLVGLFQWLWNTTMPQVFQVAEVGFWQAFRLVLIGSILFGGGRFSFGG